MYFIDVSVILINTVFLHPQIWNSMNVLSALLSNANSWKNPCFMTDFIRYAQKKTARERKLFSQIQPSHKLVIERATFCSVTCYIVLILTLILLTLGNNIVTLLFNWPKPVHYVPTDKMNAFIRIRIRHITNF